MTSHGPPYGGPGKTNEAPSGPVVTSRRNVSSTMRCPSLSGSVIVSPFRNTASAWLGRSQSSSVIGPAARRRPRTATCSSAGAGLDTSPNSARQESCCSTPSSPTARAPTAPTGCRGIPAASLPSARPQIDLFDQPARLILPKQTSPRCQRSGPRLTGAAATTADNGLVVDVEPGRFEGNSHHGAGRAARGSRAADAQRRGDRRARPWPPGLLGLYEGSPVGRSRDSTSDGARMNHVCRVIGEPSCPLGGLPLTCRASMAVQSW